MIGKITELRFSPYAIAAFFAWLALGCMVAARPDGVGTDTGTYRYIFDLLVEDSGYSTQFEPAFEGLMQLTARTGSSTLFFGLSFVLLLLPTLASMRLATASLPASNLKFFPIAALGLLLASSWFIVGSTNGLRQGISLAFVYFGTCSIFFAARPAAGLLLLAVAPLFHISSILLLPSVLLIRFLSLRSALVLFALFAGAYSFGMSEVLVRAASDLTGINIYSRIIEYGAGNPFREGWQPDLFLYTIGWPVIYLVCRKWVPHEIRENLNLALKSYALFAIPYFMLGFGNYSNRYGVMAWAFLPILHLVWLSSVKVTPELRALLTFGILVFGGVKYLLYFSQGL